MKTILENPVVITIAKIAMCLIIIGLVRRSLDLGTVIHSAESVAYKMGNIAALAIQLLGAITVLFLLFKKPEQVAA
ncbi:MAG: hypothetical protein JWQ34_775 [Mucilaginibacter sp.]|uniref:hypothetical protein n=1 Tax=Mucilaginibacter sp. TaxID=1882438 RepID=UPI002635D33E|nr:hypothetical protein [Mucilaginibacter sp.]MDB5002550.1 hypothetical protein [Mucilaginibacter sp.]